MDLSLPLSCRDLVIWSARCFDCLPTQANGDQTDGLSRLVNICTGKNLASETTNITDKIIDIENFCKIIKEEVETFSDKIENLQGNILTKLKKYIESVEIKQFVRK